MGGALCCGVIFCSAFAAAVSVFLCPRQAFADRFKPPVPGDGAVIKVCDVGVLARPNTHHVYVPLPSTRFSVFFLSSCPSLCVYGEFL